MRAEDGVDIDFGTLGCPFDAGDVADTAVAGLERGVFDGLCCQQESQQKKQKTAKDFFHWIHGDISIGYIYLSFVQR